jgi:hypothetical protein
VILLASASRALALASNSVINFPLLIHQTPTEISVTSAVAIQNQYCATAANFSFIVSLRSKNPEGVAEGRHDRNGFGAEFGFNS